MVENIRNNFLLILIILIGICLALKIDFKIVKLVLHLLVPIFIYIFLDKNLDKRQRLKVYKNPQFKKFFILASYALTIYVYFIEIGIFLISFIAFSTYILNKLHKKNYLSEAQARKIFFINIFLGFLSNGIGRFYYC